MVAPARITSYQSRVAFECPGSYAILGPDGGDDVTTNNRQIRDRIKELRRVPASELLANPKNWRLHPPAQEKALSSILREVGIADAVIARETDDGLEIINGHLRQRVLGDELVPVLVLDVDAEEATKILLTMDPLSAMATTDSDALVALLGELSDSFEITELLATVGAIETERSDPLEE